MTNLYEVYAEQLIDAFHRVVNEWLDIYERFDRDSQATGV